MFVPKRAPYGELELSCLLFCSRSIYKTFWIEKEEYKEGSPPAVKAGAVF